MFLDPRISLNTLSSNQGLHKQGCVGFFPKGSADSLHPLKDHLFLTLFLQVKCSQVHIFYDNLAYPQHNILAFQQKTQADCSLPVVANAKSVAGIHLTFSGRN